jgi:hypothetical protein
MGIRAAEKNLPPQIHLTRFAKNVDDYGAAAALEDSVLDWERESPWVDDASQTSAARGHEQAWMCRGSISGIPRIDRPVQLRTYP